eukprot:CAMPEP_0171070316 /NCGR_PEP_ID=MMETSP0766_2-20121228/9669_1 /TAXON_ID=439317 /ORGANISM="Gambierdiscus australes, Strain CAWD 149" /LENGTH=113 /DNA_ID=CAMNT_0011526773 /DNA_START=123 /DNA_END=464 /DNA_ORIENTATION=-
MALLARESANLEERILALNAANLKLAEGHREDRTHAAECKARLRTLGKREKEIAWQLGVMADQLNEASLAIVEADDNKRTAVDYHNLPGHCLNKLLGKTVQARLQVSETPPKL